MDSLEKYRPHNYDFAGGRKANNAGSKDRPFESSDINDLRDYYSGIGTRQRAMRRLNLLNGRADEEEDEGGYDPGRRTSLPAYGMERGPPPSMQQPEYENGFDDMMPPARKTSGSGYGYQPRRNGYLEEDAEEDAGMNDQLDDSTRYVLGRARNARGNKPAWQMEEVEQAKKRSGIMTR